LKKTQYRPELDGLRGISILLVVLYHFGISIFHGGFIGVDIFFVISGYLITNIITQKEFQIKKFYEGRIRRLLPALLLMIITISPLIYFISNDLNYLKNLSNTIFSIIFFLSNYYLGSKSGYFYEESQVNPFLHTWSLSIEWQFYLIFPFVLLFLIKIFQKKIILFFLIIIIINLLLIQSGGNLKINYPYFEKEFLFFRESVYFNFFSPLSRIWEFLVGAICSLIIQSRKQYNKKNFLLLFGYFLIFVSIFFFDEYNFYPNIFTLFPVLGACIIILCENNNSFFYRYISSKLLVFFGRISYSLYLWHFPVLVIFKLVFLEISFFLLIIVSVISLILSFYSWKFIENPFRDKKKVSVANIYSYCLIFFVTIIGISFYIQKNESKEVIIKKLVSNYNFEKSFNKIYDNKNLELKKRAEILDKIRKKTFLDPLKKNLLIIGDSHADNLALILNYNNQITEKYNLILYNIGTYQFYRENIDDKKLIKKFYNSRQFKESDLIILSDRIYPYKTNDALIWSLKGIEELVKFSLFSNKKILISDLSPVFLGEDDPIKSLLLRSSFQNEIFSEEDLKKKIYQLIPKKFFETQKKINHLINEKNFERFNFFELFCDHNDNKCIYQTSDNDLIFFDTNHISLKGSEFLSKKLKLEKF
jgi:peptidoglycan/LPS O-acetylase OafA/YrhL